MDKTDILIAQELYLVIAKTYSPNQVMALTEIIWAAAEQGIEPTMLISSGKKSTREFFESTPTLLQKAGIAPKPQTALTPLGKRWREIRLMVLEALWKSIAAVPGTYLTPYDKTPYDKKLP